jgi:hypothetical protein
VCRTHPLHPCGSPSLKFRYHGGHPADERQTAPATGAIVATSGIRFGGEDIERIAAADQRLKHNTQISQPTHTTTMAPPDAQRAAPILFFTLPGHL